MSTPSAGGPSGPNVPPPSGGPYGQQPPTGQFNQPAQPGQFGQFGQPGQGNAGPPPGQNFGGPGTGGPGGKPPKKGMGKGLIAGIAGGVALILLLCCIGGFFVLRGDDDESSSSTTSSTSESTSDTSTETSTSETSSDTSTSESTSETSSSSAASTGFPDEFDGWKKGTTSNAGGQETAVYRKGSDTISVVSSVSISPSDFEAVWDDDKKVGDHYCGTLSSTTQCAGEKGGTTYLVTSATEKSTSDVSAILGKYLDAV